MISLSGLGFLDLEASYVVIYENEYLIGFLLYLYFIYLFSIIK